MRILIYVHCFYPAHIYGTEAYTLAIAKELQSRGHDVRVVTTTLQGEPTQESFVVDYEWEGVPVTAYDKNLVPHHDIRGTYYQPEMRQYHERLLRRWMPDAVHINHPMSHTVALHEVCARLQIPVFGTLTDFFGICLNNKLQASNDDLCKGPNSRRSNCVSCQLKALSSTPNSRAETLKGRPILTRALGEAIALGFIDPVRRYGFASSDIQERPDILADRYKVFSALVAPSTFLQDAYRENGLSVPMRLSHFGVEIDRRDKRPTPGDALNIGYIGQIAPHKGTHILLEAARMLRGTAPNIEIWGPSDQDPAYVNQLQTLSNGLNVNFMGTFPAEKTADILSKLDLLVIPSVWYENSPLILLQALATHTPCIVSDVLGMTEFVKDGVNGFSFARGKSQSLAAVLQKFVDDSSLASRIASTTKYDRNTVSMVDDLVEVYESSHSLRI